jgi:acyl-homoserine-lactone acylase
MQHHQPGKGRGESRPAPLSAKTFGIVTVLRALALLAATFPLLAAISGLAKEATVRRDTYGVPHIIADTEQAAAFAHGFATAEDHFALMSELYLRARGELASVRGQRAFASDAMVRRLGIWERAHDRFSEVPPLMRGILDAYAAGYNSYLESHRQKAEEWMRPVSGVDVLAHCRAVLLLDFALDLRPWRAMTEPAPPAGSNMWAIGRERTQSGHGILLANPHLGWTGGYVLQEVQITVPGTINVSGAATVGCPVVTIGFNDHLGWTMTVNPRDTEDVYELTLDAADSNRYRYDGMLLPLSSREFEIGVKGASGIEVQKLEVLYSHYGPVIRKNGGKAYAYKSSNLDLVNSLTQYNLMAKATSLAEFRRALNMQQMPMFNVGYADSRGDIFYLYNGRIPQRPEGYEWSGIIPGNTSKSEWYTIHPISDLPQLTNPRGGYIQNANDSPWYTSLRQTIDKAGFPSYIGGTGLLSLRSQHGLQMLESEPAFTLEKAIQCLFDRKIVAADRFKSELAALARGKVVNGVDLTRSAELMDQWDGRIAADRQGAVLMTIWMEEYARIGKPLVRAKWSPDSPLTTPAGIGDPENALVALARAAVRVEKEFGALGVKWGDVYRIRRGDLDVPGPAAPGDFGGFTVLNYRKAPDGKWTAVAGDSYILAVEFSSPPRAYSVVTYSESSDRSSAHYNDQLKLYAGGELKPVWFTEKDIQKNLERAYRPGE